MLRKGETKMARTTDGKLMQRAFDMLDSRLLNPSLPYAACE